MPRLPRLDVPGIAQHVIQRGNDRQPCFFTSDGTTAVHRSTQDNPVGREVEGILS